MTRDEHLQWSKDRALDYLNRGKVADAMTSFMSDATKGPEPIDWSEGAYMVLSQLGMMHAIANNSTEMRRWIEGFN